MFSSNKWTNIHILNKFSQIRINTYTHLFVLHPYNRTHVHYKNKYSQKFVVKIEHMFFCVHIMWAYIHMLSWKYTQTCGKQVHVRTYVWHIERMFAESTRVCFLIRKSVLYIMNMPLPRHFSTFSFPYLYYTTIYYIQKRNTLSRAFSFCPFLTLLHFFPYTLYYILYI